MLEAELAAHQHGRVPGELRRRQILAEAERLLGEVGYAEMQMDELARRVGVTKPVIYGLIGPKHEVFSEVMALASRDLGLRIAEAVDAAGPEPAAKLGAGALAFFEWIEDRADAWQSLLSSPDMPAVEAVSVVRERQASYLAMVLEDRAFVGNEAGSAELVDAVAHGVNGVFEALAAWWADHPVFTAKEMADLGVALVGPGLGELMGLTSEGPALG